MTTTADILDVRPFGSPLGAEIVGLDLARATAPDIAAVRAALLRHKVVCIRDQSFSPREYADAMARFGETRIQLRRASRHADVDRIMILSSEDRDDKGDGKRVVVGAWWHTDDSYMEIPCSITVLHGVAIPSHGGDTQFVNMKAAYDDLDAATKARIDGLRCVHKYDSRRKGTRIMTRTAEETDETPDVLHPLVRTHPETGEKALYINPNRIDHVQGMDLAEGDALLDALIAHCISGRYEYRHVWRRGDVLMWDNRSTMHKANADYPEGELREMHRVIIEGDRPF